jgi:catalase/peroxidase HPI
MSVFTTYVFVALLYGTFVTAHTPSSSLTEVEKLRQTEYAKAVEKLDFDAIKNDLKQLFTDSKPWWPADYGHYGPFFIRLAWHCSGSYRTSDGRGGCAGGRQRFDPERSWDDNTNLDKARKLLWPIKEKYGLGLSWGDLFILAGTTAIEDLGGESLGFCAGRVDDPDGSQSVQLGPTEEQEALEPCETQGDCKKPLGSTTIGLIYLNPEGPQGQPLPAQSAPQVRDTFGRMAMNDSETVSLIGGGHSFGKTHGACPTPPGPAPTWPGNCGSGVGVDAFTSGFEGPWTQSPLTFDNSYFVELLNRTWDKKIGPGGKYQWHVTSADPPQYPLANCTSGNCTQMQDLMMLTTDISLINDPEYKKIVELFASDMGAFTTAFKHSWYKLTTRDMGPVTRCLGKLTPPAQPFQYPLPPAPSELADFDAVKTEIKSAITKASAAIAPDTADGQAYYGAMFTRLAWQCSSTFRVTDYLGGCNGARIRLSPQKDWAVNQDLDLVLKVLEPIKGKFGAKLSWADLIVLAGQTALEQAGAPKMVFCPGRSDAADGDLGSEYLKPREWNFNESVTALRQSQLLLDLTDREMVALQARLRSSVLQNNTGYKVWTDKLNVLSNQYFKVLLNDTNVWEAYTNPDSMKKQYRAQGKDIYMLPSDIALLQDPSYMTIAEDFASDDSMFRREFATAWTKVVNADRFDGPVRSVCAAQNAGADSPTPEYEIVLVSVAGTVIVGALVFGCLRYFRKKSGTDYTRMDA